MLIFCEIDSVTLLMLFVLKGVSQRCIHFVGKVVYAVLCCDLEVGMLDVATSPSSSPYAVSSGRSLAQSPTPEPM